jgi:enoyl-CoA hydratase/carnithine racemase
VDAAALLVERSADGLLTLTFNRPTRRNAFNDAIYIALARALREARLDEQVKVVLLTGAQGYFSAGNDLADFIGYDRRDDFLPAAFLRELAACTKPVVAAVEGGAIGVGATLLLHCDFVYAGRSTRLHMPFIHLNVCPEGGSSVLLPARAGSRRAARWLLLGEPFDATQAQEADLVTEVLDDGATLAHAQAVAQRLAALDPAALQTTKRLLRGDLPALQATMAVELEHFTDLLSRPPAQAALVRMTQRKSNPAPSA